MWHYLDAIIYLVVIGLYGIAVSIYIPKKYYSYSNILIGLGSIVYGVVLGLSGASMGLSPGNLAKDALLVAGIACVIVVVLFIINLIPPVHRLFTDAPSKRFTKRGAAHELLFRIPFGTALSEEIIFRGVLLGILLKDTTKLSALFIAAIAFGLWHIIPTLQTVRANDAFKTIIGDGWQHHVFSIVVTVLVTSVAGFVFGWLRILTGSLLVPWALHTLANGFSIGNAYLRLAVQGFRDNQQT